MPCTRTSNGNNPEGTHARVFTRRATRKGWQGTHWISIEIWRLRSWNCDQYQKLTSVITLWLIPIPVFIVCHCPKLFLNKIILKFLHLILRWKFLYPFWLLPTFLFIFFKLIYEMGGHKGFVSRFLAINKHLSCVLKDVSSWRPMTAWLRNWLVAVERGTDFACVSAPHFLSNQALWGEKIDISGHSYWDEQSQSPYSNWNYIYGRF